MKTGKEKRKKKNPAFGQNLEKQNLVERSNYLENLSGRFHLPADILEGSAIISLVGRKSVRVENYKGIIEYTEECIKLQTKSGKLVLEGMHLNMDYCTDVELHVTGRIKQIRFMD